MQERLGYALRKQLSYKPAILCLGAAIAFLSGGQANIPNWADRLMLGWLFRPAAALRGEAAAAEEGGGGKFEAVCGLT